MIKALALALLVLTVGCESKAAKEERLKQEQVQAKEEQAERHRAERRAKYDEVRVGMTKAQVKAVLGAPDDTVPESLGAPYWQIQEMPEDKRPVHWYYGFRKRKTGEDVLATYYSCNADRNILFANGKVMSIEPDASFNLSVPQK